MYADTVTPSMDVAITETRRRRELQDAYNKAHGIVPKTIVKSVRDLLEISSDAAGTSKSEEKMSRKEREETIARLEKEMRQAAKMLEFEYAAQLRDRIIRLRGQS